MAKLDWERAKRQGAGSSPRAHTDTGEVFLPGGTITSVRKIMAAGREQEMSRLRACIRCGVLKNGHHFTTRPGRERRICAKCVAADPSLDQTSTIKTGPTSLTTGTVRWLRARKRSRCNACPTWIEEGDRFGWDPIDRKGYCTSCSPDDLTRFRKR